MTREELAQQKFGASYSDLSAWGRQTIDLILGSGVDPESVDINSEESTIQLGPEQDASGRTIEGYFAELELKIRTLEQQVAEMERDLDWLRSLAE